MPLRDRFLTLTNELVSLFRRSPEWAIIVFAWITAGFIPAYWFMGEDHWWIQSQSPLFFQPFVPLFCAAILWQDRAKLLQTWQRASRSKRRGSPWVIWLGCLIVLASHLVHVLTVATIGLLVVAVGIVYLAYGVGVVKQSTRALLFGLLMVPPPTKPLSTVAQRLSSTAWTKTVAAAQHLGRDCTCTIGQDSSTIVIQGHFIEVPNPQLAAIVFTGFVLLFYSLWRRERVGPTLLTMAVGGLLAGIFCLLIPLIALCLPVTPLTDLLVRVHPMVTCFIATGITVVIRSQLANWMIRMQAQSRSLSKLSTEAQKMTDKATAGMAASVGGSVGKAGRGVTKGLENAMDSFFAAIAKPFKRKRKDRW